VGYTESECAWGGIYLEETKETKESEESEETKESEESEETKGYKEWQHFLGFLSRYWKLHPPLMDLLQHLRVPLTLEGLDLLLECFDGFSGRN
jgi:hypothetical protein